MDRYPTSSSRLPPRASCLGSHPLRPLRHLAVTHRRPPYPGGLGNRRNARTRVLSVDGAAGGGEIILVRVRSAPTAGCVAYPDVCSVPTGAGASEAPSLAGPA